MPIDKEFNLGKLNFKIFIEKNNDETKALKAINNQNPIPIKNFHKMSIDILDQRPPEILQNIINSLEPGIYELNIDLSNENFNKIEQVDAEVIEDDKI
jgi:hypothetical protein